MLFLEAVWKQKSGNQHRLQEAIMPGQETVDSEGEFLVLNKWKR